MSSLSARETAYQTIRSRIITMELKPGDPLNDRELAEELGISRTPMREALPINLKLMEMEQFARYTLEKEILNRLRGHVTPRQEEEYRSNIETYRELEADMSQPDRTARMLELDNAFHRKSFELCGMEAHYDHMLASLQHVERIRKFSLQTEENKSVCSSHTAILEALLHGSADDVSEALESHLSRYKQSVAQARSVHPEYFIDE